MFGKKQEQRRQAPKFTLEIDHASVVEGHSLKFTAGAGDVGSAVAGATASLTTRMGKEYSNLPVRVYTANTSAYKAQLGQASEATGPDLFIEPNGRKTFLAVVELPDELKGTSEADPNMGKTRRIAKLRLGVRFQVENAETVVESVRRDGERTWQAP